MHDRYPKHALSATETVPRSGMYQQILASVWQVHWVVDVNHSPFSLWQLLAPRQLSIPICTSFEISLQAYFSMQDFDPTVVLPNKLEQLLSPWHVELSSQVYPLKLVQVGSQDWCTNFSRLPNYCYHLKRFGIRASWCMSHCLCWSYLVNSLRWNS